MVARCRHRRALAPSVGCGVVFLDRSDRRMRPQRMHGRLIRTWHGAADNVYLVADRGRDRRPALGGHRRQRFPIVCRGIVFPRVVDRHPGWRAGLRKDEAAERVDLSASRRAEQLLSRLGEGCELRPLPLSESPARPNHTGKRKDRGAYENHGLLLAWILYYKPARFFAFTALFTTLSGHSPESTRRTSPGAPA